MTAAHTFSKYSIFRRSQSGGGGGAPANSGRGNESCPWDSPGDQSEASIVTRRPIRGPGDKSEGMSDNITSDNQDNKTHAGDTSNCEHNSKGQTNKR